ncbi:hypothetical protein ACFLTE_09835 [Bacteroidota bacterium]
MRYFLILIGLCIAFSIRAQDISLSPESSRKTSLAVSMGLGASYTDKAFLLNVPASLSIDYKISENYFLQFAPKYTWLVRWNEHYLSLPLHLGIRVNKKISFFAGPALTYDIRYFKDLGISAGIYYHFGKRSSLALSAYTFTLYDYNIDYLFLPIALTYNFKIIK